MKREPFKMIVLFLACSVAAAAGPTSNSASFRIVTYMNQVGQPGGIMEGSPGVFYLQTASPTPSALTVTPQGTKKVLLTFPTGYNLESSFIDGANGRFYSAVELSDLPATVFSVSSMETGDLTYSPQALVPTLTQTLPDAKLLGLGAQLVGSGVAHSLAYCDLNGNTTLIYQFPTTDLPDSAIRASDGNYYGVVQTKSASTGYVFRVTPSGAFSKLFTFPSGSFNGYNGGPLIQASDGNLYGALAVPGTNGQGLIYRLTLSGQYTVIYNFAAGNNGGPSFLLEANDGNIYGSTLGALGQGGSSELFRVTKSGEFTLLYTMSITADGACTCTLVQADDGIIYGTAAGGGITNGGTIFALDVGLPKPAPHPQIFNPKSGAPGTKVLIWGTQLLSPSVTFNGVTAAEVTSSGPNYVWATVPAGASSGPLTITTPGGSVTTQASFTVE